MSDESSQPQDIPDSQQCRSSRDSDSDLYACSQPDRSSLNDNWFVRDLSRSVVSLSFRNLYLDGERTILLQQDEEDKDREQDIKDGAQNPGKNAQESPNNECDLGENHRSLIWDKDLLIPLPNLTEVSTCIASQKETREFYAKEISEYVMIGATSGDEKVNGHTKSCDSYSKHIDDDFSTSMHELTRANTDQKDQTDSPHIKNRASISTMNTSSTSSVNDLDLSRQSSLNASINSYVSQTPSVTEVGGKVHHCEVTASLSRMDMCLGISQTSPVDKVKLASFKLCGTKITCYLHYLGLDQDCKPNGSLTLTAILHLPKGKRGDVSLLDHKKCTVKLTVSAYEGRVEERNIMNEPRVSLRELDDDDHQRLTMHMTVHDIVRQEAIIFSEKCPEKNFFKIKTEISLSS